MRSNLISTLIGLLCIAYSGSAQDLDPGFISDLKEHLIKKDVIIDNRYPEYTKDGIWQFRDEVNWLSGFLGGELWNLWELTGNPELRERAIRHAESLLPYAGIDYTHDMGFIFVPTLVAAHLHTGDRRFAEGAVYAAAMLAKRYNPAGQFIRAWGKLGSPDRAGWMIIDTMMNLELLFWAAEYTGDRTYYDLAYRHALTTMKLSIRDNGSSFHVIQFDPETGVVIRKNTHQGYSDSSTWARGQAWGIYGFANAYRHTGDQRFLETSRRMADYFLNHLPPDLVPYWDLDLTDPETLRDASAAAIASSGLFLLAGQREERDAIESYQAAAVKITRNLIRGYTFKSSSLPQQGLLLHTIYHYHKEWGVDESFPAGDYFFTETVNKYWQYLKARQPMTGFAERQTINFNTNWYYLSDPVPEISQLHNSPDEWRRVNLPHTWNQWDATDITPGYRRNNGWYEKELYIPAMKSPARIILYFEGANINASVYVNRQLAGQHTGGYLGFEVDITEFLKFGRENSITVCVDNSYNPYIIPSQKSDFFIYGGITRDVWLKIVPATHIEHIMIRTPSVSKDIARTTCEIHVSGENTDGDLQLKATILDPDGRPVTTSQVNTTGRMAQIPFEEIYNPRLWSPLQPELYTLDVRLLSGDEELDGLQERFGYRWFEFKEHGPFYLNGERLLLRGTHRHEEHAGYGAAMPDSLHRKDMKMIKEMGANFVRLAHYPQDPEVYRACDELGLLVWDELPWCRGGVGPELWKNNTEQMLREMIRQNINHPCIVVWSLGNEIYWLPDFPDGGNLDSLRTFLIKLHDIAHEMDPGRVTAIRKFYEGADIVDVFSPSIWAGWYSGVYTNYEKALLDAREKYDRFFHAEYGGSSHVGRHVENPIDGEGIISPDGWEELVNQYRVKNIAREGDWSENYIVDLFDWHLNVSEKLDWFTGNAQWAFKDFGTPLRPENAIPYVNQKGLLDRSGNPKDAYFVFKSSWTDSPIFCYIESHTWTVRSGPPDTPREVCVYSNADEVELHLNGSRLGKKRRDRNAFPAQGLYWQVAFMEGRNRLLAYGYKKGKLAAIDSLDIDYTYKKHGKADHIDLNAIKLTSGNFLIEAVVCDSEGNRCLDYQDRIYFSADGPERLLVNWGISSRSKIIEAANGKAAIEFKPVPDGRSVIEARNQDFKGSYIVIDRDLVVDR